MVRSPYTLMLACTSKLIQTLFFLHTYQAEACAIFKLQTTFLGSPAAMIIFKFKSFPNHESLIISFIQTNFLVLYQIFNPMEGSVYLPKPIFNIFIHDSHHSSKDSSFTKSSLPSYVCL